MVNLPFKHMIPELKVEKFPILRNLPFGIFQLDAPIQVFLPIEQCYDNTKV